MQTTNKSNNNHEWSHWERMVFFDEVDIVIIGGGIVGINAAIRLKELKPKWKIVVVERGILPFGASTRNAGFACFGSVTELMDDLQSHSEDAVFSLVQKRWQGLQRLRQRVGDQRLEYKGYGAFELFKNTESNFDQYESQLEYFNKRLASIIQEDQVFKLVDEKIPSFGFQKINHLIYNKAEGQINPGRMMKTLWEIARNVGVQILTGIEVANIRNENKEVVVECNENINLKTTKVLLATNGFTKRIFPELEVLPARNQVLITKPIPQLPLQGCFHYDKGYFYFRNVGNRILLGGGRNLAKEEEETDVFGHTPLIQKALVDLMQTIILPTIPFEIDRWWSGILGVGKRKQPIIKQIENNIYTAVRLGGMGVAIGTLVGEEAAELIVDT